MGLQENLSFHLKINLVSSSYGCRGKMENINLESSKTRLQTKGTKEQLFLSKSHDFFRGLAQYFKCLKLTIPFSKQCIQILRRCEEFFLVPESATLVCQNSSKYQLPPFHFKGTQQANCSQLPLWLCSFIQQRSKAIIIIILITTTTVIIKSLSHRQHLAESTNTGKN